MSGVSGGGPPPLHPPAGDSIPSTHEGRRGALPVARRSGGVRQPMRSPRGQAQRWGRPVPCCIVMVRAAEPSHRTRDAPAAPCQRRAVRQPRRQRSFAVLRMTTQGQRRGVALPSLATCCPSSACAFPQCARCPLWCIVCCPSSACAFPQYARCPLWCIVSGVGGGGLPSVVSDAPPAPRSFPPAAGPRWRVLSGQSVRRRVLPGQAPRLPTRGRRNRARCAPVR